MVTRPTETTGDSVAGTGPRNPVHRRFPETLGDHGRYRRLTHNPPRAGSSPATPTQNPFAESDLGVAASAVDQGTSPRRLLVVDRDAVVAAPVVAEGLPYLGNGFSRDLEGVKRLAALFPARVQASTYLRIGPRAYGGSDGRSSRHRYSTSSNQSRAPHRLVLMSRGGRRSRSPKPGALPGLGLVECPGLPDVLGQTPYGTFRGRLPGPSSQSRSPGGE